MPDETNTKKEFERLRFGNDRLVVPKLPQMPQVVLDRFPELALWQKEMEDWRVKLNTVISGVP